MCSDVSRWLVVESDGQCPPAMQLVHDAGRTIESQIDGHISAHGERIFALLQGKARALLAEVSALPPLPTGIWVSPAPDEDLSRLPAHRSTWGVLQATYFDFEQVHRVAWSIRENLGAGPDSLPDGAPGWALTFRNWKPLLNDMQFSHVRKPLRLPYAIEHGYEPGLWRPEDVKTTAEDRSFFGKLRNLGQAVR